MFHTASDGESIILLEPMLTFARGHTIMPHIIETTEESSRVKLYTAVSIPIVTCHQNCPGDDKSLDHERS